MISVQCPHCSQATQADPAMAGQAASCAACGGQFTVPFVVVPPKVKTALPGSARKRKPKRHWTKTAMLIATVAWPVLCVLVCLIAGVSLAGDYQDLGNGYRRDLETGAVLSDAVVGGALVTVWIFWGMVITFFYMATMFVLLVVWFATKDE